MTVEVACEILVGAVGVLEVPSGFPDALVVVAFGMPVLGEEQLISNSATSRQTQLVEKRDAGLTIQEEDFRNLIGCSFFL